MVMFTLHRALSMLSALLIVSSASAEPGEFEPSQNVLPVAAPEGAIMLFDSTDAHQFLNKHGKAINWPIEKGALVSTRGETRSNHIVSKVHFQDADIHVEFMTAEQAKGNSGIYLHGQYELQILNSAGVKEPTMNDCGALYGFSKPFVNACRAPGEWQVYDIRYRAPRRDESGTIVEEGQLTAWLNGQRVQHNVRFGKPRSKYNPYRYKTTPYLIAIAEEQKKTGLGPLFLQDHDSPTRFRNVWIIPHTGSTTNLDEQKESSD